jgi:hypothetical protein
VSTNNTFNTYSQPDSQTSVILDADAPLSYKVWYKTRTGIIPKQEFIQYNTYLTEWYQNKQKENTDFNSNLQVSYLALLRQLQIFTNNAETEKWYNEINFNDEKELLIAIPYFARKLKNIAIYYLQLREEIKKSKIKYNQTGSNKSLTHYLQEQLLLNFTKKIKGSVTLPQSVWTNLPELSSAKDTLSITIEELYDDHHYGDQNTNLPVSAYYNLNDINLTNYLNSQNISLTDTEWIYKQGNTTVTVQDLANTLNLTKDIFTKYIGEKKFTDLQSTTTPLLCTPINIYDVSIETGSNFFYWPYGSYKPDISTITRLEAIPLTSAKIEFLGTGGTDVVNSDTIFVKTARGVEGAWLRFKQYEETPELMTVYVEGNKQVTFKYPFPGFGLSADDTDWTGPSLQYTSEYQYLESNLKELVNQAYWNLDISLSGADSIQINDTTLIEVGAYPSEKYNTADKIRIRPSSPGYTDPAAYGDTQEAWLYKMVKSDIPIGSENNLIVWPYQRISNTEPFPSYFPKDITTVCEPVGIQDLNIPFATSSNSITASDVVYKLAKYTDAETDATECAWLSGQTYTYGKYTGTSQSGLNAIFRTGEYVHFVWEGEDLTDANNVFKSLRHQPDCTFARTASSYKEFNLCNCKATLFTPFGHPSTEFTDNNSLADFIIEQVNDEFVDLTTWTDFNGTTYTSSSAFAFYKTNNSIGWGDGSWYSGASSVSNKFFLRQGHSYIYRRASDNTLEQPDTFPFFVARYPYNRKSLWVNAIKDNEGNWNSSNTSSSMILRPGDVILYKKAPTATYSAISSVDTATTEITATNQGSIWATYDYLTIDKDVNGLPQTTTVSYPNVFYPYGAKTQPEYIETYAQYPDVNYGNVVTASWKLIDPEGTEYDFYNTFSFNFVPLTLGNYTVLLTAITAAQVSPTQVYTASTSGYYIFSGIPQISAVELSTTTTQITISSYTQEAPGFVINTPLFGWNYNTGKPNSNANGVKPFWAFSNTANKDVISWGASFRIIDDYNVVTQPLFSELVISTGNLVEYDRKYISSFTWIQPINYKVEVNENIWSTIQIVTTATSNLEPILYNLTNNLISIPTTDISPITLTNVIDNQPVEVYYKSVNPFVWSVSATPIVATSEFGTANLGLIADPLKPWNNLTNRYFPAYAIFPALDKLYSATDKGGYFTPNNLGISTYLNKDFTSLLSVSSSVLSSYFEDGTKRAGGRGFTKQDQPTPYTIVEDNNTWLKEPVTSGPIAGNLKKQVTKKYQKFIPYQSVYETNPKIQLGLVLPTSRQTPWGGNESLIWTDKANKPQNFSGVVNVSAWSDTQILKQTGKVLDNWVTDIFGNQYGLYKDVNNTSPYERRFIPGEIWVRKNTQFVSPGKEALSAVFDTYTALNLYNQLTGVGVTKIDMFFDTLYVETTSAIILEDLDYNFDTSNISSITDNARFISLAIPVSANLIREIQDGGDVTNYNIFTIDGSFMVAISGEELVQIASTDFAKPGDTWFLPEEKAVIISTCYQLSSLGLYPELYKLNLVTRDFQKIFPNNQDVTTLRTVLSTYTTFDPPVLSYDKTKNEFLLTLLAGNTDIIEFTVLNIPDSPLKNITVYTSTNENIKIPPSVTSSLSLTATTSVTFSYTVSASNNPISYAVTDSTTYPWISANNSGIFTGTPTVSGNFYIPFVIINSVGPTYYSLNITVSS